MANDAEKTDNSRRVGKRRYPIGGRWGRLESRWVTVDGRRMHARVSIDPVPPDRIPVVMVHALVLSSRFMAPLSERLAAHFQVYAPDLPGFGDSEAPPFVLNIPHSADALAEWMEAMGMDRAALVGSSLGCQIVTDLAVRYPERVERAVLIGPTTDPSARTVRQQIGRFLADTLRENLSLGLVHLRDYARTDPRRAWRTFRYMMEDSIEERLPRMRMPTLVVRGSQDPVVPQPWAEEATRLLPQGQIRGIPGSAHATHFGAPLECTRVIRPFLLADSPTASPSGAHLGLDRSNR